MLLSRRLPQAQNLWSLQQHVCGVECQLGVRVQPQPLQRHWKTGAQRDQRRQHHLLR